MNGPPDQLRLIEARRIVLDGLTRRFLTSDGLMARNNPPDARSLFDNFDDTAPFVLAAGGAPFLLDQIARLPADPFADLLAEGGVVYAYGVDEFAGGLAAVHRATGDPAAGARAAAAFVKARELFADDRLGLSECVDLTDGRRSPNFAPWSAALIEAALEGDRPDPAWIAVGARTMTLWLAHPFVRRHGLFPYRGAFSAARAAADRLAFLAGRRAAGHPHGPARGLSRRVARWRYDWTRSGSFARLMKSNTSPFFALLALADVDRSADWHAAAGRWLDAACARLESAGAVRGVWTPAGPEGPPTLLDAFILVDALCDAYWRLAPEPRWLDAALRIAAFALGRRRPDGLIPSVPDGETAHIDHQVDFAVSLARVAQLAGRADFARAAYALIAAIVERHATPTGFATHVGRDGKPVLSGRRNEVDPKYNALLLKGILLAETIDMPIYGDAARMDLFKDR